MAPPKREKVKVTFVNVRFPTSVYKELKKVAKASKITPTEFCRNVAIAAVDSYQHQQQAA